MSTPGNHPIRSNRMVWLGLAIVLSMLACNLPVTRRPAVGTPAAGETSPAPTRSNIKGSGSFDLPDPATGLSTLSGYRQSLKITFNGQRAGKAVQTTTTYHRDFVRQPLASLLTIDIAGQGNATHDMVASLPDASGQGQEQASQTGGQSCQVTWSDAPASANQANALEPASLLPPLVGAESAGDETIAGVDASAYKFDQRALGWAGSSQASGEVWIAKNGGWVVKYSLALKGQADLFGQGSSGEQDWDYTVSEAGTFTAVQLPSGCPALLEDIPTLPDAKNITRQPKYLGYQTATSLAEATTFYLNQLKSAGWTNTVNIKPGGNNPGGKLVFTSGTRQIFIALTAQGTGLQVTVQELK